VFVIWEPILPTDWSPPSTFALHRIGDSRARQFWDPDHIVSKKLAADARPPQPQHDCCDQSDTLWDLVAVYPTGAMWSDRIPPAIVFNGPVIDRRNEMETALRSSSSRKLNPGQP
jgi:hypothetical protein